MTTLKGILIMIALIGLATILMVTDPLNINVNDSLWPLIYIIPSVIGFVWLLWKTNKK